MFKRSLNRLLRYGSALCLALVFAQPAAAQVPFTGQPGPAGQTIVEEQLVIENVRSAFNFAAGNLFVEAGLEPQQTDRARQLVESLTGRFITEARLEINNLKGDGVLDAAEVTSAIAELRATYLEELEQALEALTGGYPTPPLRASFNSTTAYVQAVLEYALIIRNSAADWLWLAGALVGGLILAWLISKLLRYTAGKLRDVGRRWVAELAEGLVGPLYLVAIVLALRLGFEWLWLPGIADDAIEQFVSVALVGAVFWFVWHACDVLAHGFAWLLKKTYHTEFDRHVVVLMSRTLRIVALALFVLLFVNGILDSDLTGVIAGLGVLGVALSFLMRGTIENVAASFTIFGDKPFRIGDLIIYDDQWGRIEDIGFRSTRFRTLDGHLITIPNAELIDHALHNVGARPSIRRRFRIGLTYDTPPDKVEEAMAILHELLTDHEGQPADQKAHVAFETFGDFSLQLLVQYHYEPADYWQALDFDTRLNLDIKRRFADAEIELAFPTQSLYVHGADGAFGLRQPSPDTPDRREPRREKDAGVSEPADETAEEAA